MKFLLAFSFVLVLASSIAFSQMLPGEETKRRDVRSSEDYFYVTLSPKVYSVNEETIWELALKGSYIFNKYFGIGFGYYGTLSRNLQPNEELSSAFIRAQNFGPEFDFTFKIKDWLIISNENHFGVGFASYEVSRAVSIVNFDQIDFFLVFEPSASLSAKISNNIYGHFRYGYRFTSGFKLGDAPEDLLNTQTFSLGVKLIL